jgi:hypothetical protein
LMADQRSRSKPSIRAKTMPNPVPSGYLTIREALNRLGHELFGSDWTGDEHKARRGLIGEDEWSKIKDLPLARGSGAMLRSTKAPAAKPAPHSSDPSDPSYQKEYRARKRHMDAHDRLRQLLEAGELEAAILNPWTGELHRASASLWRRHDADRMIERGRAPIPGSPNIGPLLVKRFAEAKMHTKPLPAAKIKEAIEALKVKMAAENLTRPQQEDFVRKTFPSYHLTERQFRKIFQAVPVLPGRPKKSDKRA